VTAHLAVFSKLSEGVLDPFAERPSDSPGSNDRNGKMSSGSGTDQQRTSDHQHAQPPLPRIQIAPTLKIHCSYPAPGGVSKPEKATASIISTR